jgi:hypothetical protein
VTGGDHEAGDHQRYEERKPSVIAMVMAEHEVTLSTERKHERAVRTRRA